MQQTITRANVDSDLRHFMASLGYNELRITRMLYSCSNYENLKYRQISNISHTKSQNLNVSCLVLQLSLCNLSNQVLLVENEDVGAAPIGDAPTTSEWSTILFPTKACLILEIWR